MYFLMKCHTFISPDSESDSEFNLQLEVADTADVAQAAILECASFL